jgi:hypothetical protein
VPARERDGAGMRRHLNESHARLPCSGAAESFVSFIPLFDGKLMPLTLRPLGFPVAVRLRLCDSRVRLRRIEH